MAVTQLSDLQIASEIFNRSMFQESLDLDAFIQSGVAYIDPEVNAFLNSDIGGSAFSRRFIKPLESTESNVSSDDPDTSSTPKKLEGIKETLVRHSRNNSWSSMDLAAERYGVDPLGGIQTRLAKYWLTQRQKSLIKSLEGVKADNVANDDGDMVNDVSGESGDAAHIDGTATIDALLTLGDRLGEVSAMGVHSIIWGRLKKNDLIEYERESDTNIIFPRYMGFRLIVDDGFPVDDTDSGDYTYTSVLFGPNAIALGMGAPKTPIEVDRSPDAGNGGGQETLYSRVEMAIHPVGFQYTTATSPTWANLALAASWDRVVERKRIPMAFLDSKA